MVSPLKVVFAGGGTGGHLYPALNLAAAMEERWDVLIRFFGTKRGIENRKVPEAGYELIHIPVAGFQRRLTIQNVGFPFKLWKSMRICKQYLKAFQPDVVIGTGGYVMGPVLRTAVRLGIPVVLQEQNSYPGVTTRMLSADAALVFVAYDESLSYIKCDHAVVSGNPVSFKPVKTTVNDLLQSFGLSENRKVVLVSGGSQGSAHINEAVADILSTDGLIEDYQLLWQTGEQHYQTYKDFVDQLKDVHVSVRPFIDRMHEAYQIAAFAVCRAGAMTLSELMMYGVPSILVPFPYAAGDHQFKNAQTVSKKGGAVVVRDDNRLADNLKTQWQAFIQGSVDLEAMKKAVKSMRKADSVSLILDEIRNMLITKNRWPLQ